MLYMWPNLLTNTLPSDDDISSILMMIGRRSHKTNIKQRGLKIHCEVSRLVRTTPGTHQLMLTEWGRGFISSTGSHSWVSFKIY